MTANSAVFSITGLATAVAAASKKAGIPGEGAIFLHKNLGLTLRDFCFILLFY